MNLNCRTNIVVAYLVGMERDGCGDDESVNHSKKNGYFSTPYLINPHNNKFRSCARHGLGY